MRLALPYLAAVLIACATPAHAQTLPIYDVDGQVAKCMAGAPAQGEEMAKKNHLDPGAMRSLAETGCIMIQTVERQSREELAKDWNAFDSSTRLWCIGNKQVTNYSALQECINRGMNTRPPLPRP